jgi:hypothetical protein
MTIVYNSPLSAGLQNLLDSVQEIEPIETAETRYEGAGVELGAFRAAPVSDVGLRPGVLISSGAVARTPRVHRDRRRCLRRRCSRRAGRREC